MRNCTILVRPTMKSVLLTVEDTFTIQSAGLLIAPELDPKLFPTLSAEQQIPVVLERPDGTAVETDLTVSLAHFNPQGYRVVCSSRVLSKHDVPVGTKVWWDTGEAV